MREKSKRIFEKILIAFLAVIFAWEAGSIIGITGIDAVAMAAEPADTKADKKAHTEQAAAVSGNDGEMENSREIGREGEDPLETYNGIPTEWLNESEESVYDPESGVYLTQDAFYNASTKKGIQGDFNGASYKASYGSAHTLININVTDFSSVMNASFGIPPMKNLWNYYIM